MTDHIYTDEELEAYSWYHQNPKTRVVPAVEKVDCRVDNHHWTGCRHSNNCKDQAEKCSKYEKSQYRQCCMWLNEEMCTWRNLK
jgi:hypothetical protein